MIRSRRRQCAVRVRRRGGAGRAHCMPRAPPQGLAVFEAGAGSDAAREIGALVDSLETQWRAAARVGEGLHTYDLRLASAAQFCSTVMPASSSAACQAGIPRTIWKPTVV